MTNEEKYEYDVIKGERDDALSALGKLMEEYNRCRFLLAWTRRAMEKAEMTGIAMSHAHIESLHNWCFDDYRGAKDNCTLQCDHDAIIAAIEKECGCDPTTTTQASKAEEEK